MHRVKVRWWLVNKMKGFVQLDHRWTFESFATPAGDREELQRL